MRTTLNLPQAKQLYDMGLLREIGLVYFYLAIQTECDCKFSKTAEEIRLELELTKAPFYRALTALKALKLPSPKVSIYLAKHEPARNRQHSHR